MDTSQSTNVSERLPVTPSSRPSLISGFANLKKLLQENLDRSIAHLNQLQTASKKAPNQLKMDLSAQTAAVASENPIATTASKNDEEVALLEEVSMVAKETHEEKMHFIEETFEDLRVEAEQSHLRLLQEIHR